MRNSKTDLAAVGAAGMAIDKLASGESIFTLRTVVEEAQRYLPNGSVGKWHAYAAIKTAIAAEQIASMPAGLGLRFAYYPLKNWGRLGN